MKLAVSNLAWNENENDQIVELLHKYKIQYIEVACSKISIDINKYRKFWKSNNIKIVATTSLLYGKPELNLFESKTNREKTLTYLKEQADKAHALEAKAMMFGSPKSRIKDNLTKKEAFKISKEFFTILCNYTAKYKISLAFEPNPPIYGGDFIHKTEEAVELAKFIDHEYFGINLDASTICSNKENYDKSVRLALPFVKHAHISEPFLKPIPNNETDHEAFSKVLKKYKYNKYLSIEMPLNDDINHIKQIEKTLKFVTSIYKKNSTTV